MPPVSAGLLLLALAGAIIWWQTSFIRTRLAAAQFDPERGTLVGIAGVITGVLAFNGVTLIKNLHTEWIEYSQWMDVDRLDLLLRQVGFLFGFYAFAMVFWNAIRGRVLDLERAVWERTIRFGLTENQRLVAGVAINALALPSVVRNAFAPFGHETGGAILIVTIPLSLFAMEVTAEVLLTKFIRRGRRAPVSVTGAGER